MGIGSAAIFQPSNILSFYAVSSALVGVSRGVKRAYSLIGSAALALSEYISKCPENKEWYQDKKVEWYKSATDNFTSELGWTSVLLLSSALAMHLSQYAKKMEPLSQVLVDSIPNEEELKAVIAQVSEEKDNLLQLSRGLRQEVTSTMATVSEYRENQFPIWRQQFSDMLFQANSTLFENVVPKVNQVVDQGVAISNTLHLEIPRITGEVSAMVSQTNKTVYEVIIPKVDEITGKALNISSKVLPLAEKVETYGPIAALAYGAQQVIITVTSLAVLLASGRYLRG